MVFAQTKTANGKFSHAPVDGIILDSEKRQRSRLAVEKLIPA